MKTLQFFLVIAIIACLSVTLQAKEYGKAVVTNSTELKTLIGEKFQEDISRLDNYLYQNNVSSIKSDVKVTFYISSDGTVKVTKVECKDCDAGRYVKHLLEASKLEVVPTMRAKKYSLNLKLIYKTV